MKRACLLTGEPGCGKTTIIKEVLAKSNRSAGGFYTEEIRSKEVRQGFKIVTLDGKSAILAHIDIRSPCHVSKYGVDVESMDKLAVPTIEDAVGSKDIVIIDEIGKMELFSHCFKEAVSEALQSGEKVLGTIMLASHPWADKIKERPEVEIIRATKANRSEVIAKVLDWLAT